MKVDVYREVSRTGLRLSGGGKGAPPAIPPIIINPFSYQTPAPAIDPRITPLGPPITPVYRPDLRFAELARH